MSNNRGLRTSSLRMLDIRAVSPEPHLRPYCPSLCIAPSAIFPDYERVMAHLKAERGGRDDARYIDVETGRHEGHDAGRVFVDSDSRDSAANEGVSDEQECRQKPRACYMAWDISNIYSNRATQEIASRRRARQSKPYDGRRYLVDPSVDARSSTHCPYISPDNKQCKKINKSPQEAGRHWRSCHVYKEAKDMLMGVLAVGQGVAITSQAQLDEVAPLIRCSSCDALITRSDAMRRHVRSNCRAQENAQGSREGGVSEAR